MPPTGDSIAYIAGTRHIDIPLADGHVYRHPHQVKRKPTGLDWNALTPTCKGCDEKSGQLDATSHCPTCRGEAPKSMPTATSGRNQTFAEDHPDDVAARFTAPTEPLVDIHASGHITVDDLTKLPTAGKQGQPTTRRSAPRATSTSSTSGRAPDAGPATHREKNPPATQETRPAVAGGPDHFTPEANLQAQLDHATRVLRNTATSTHPAITVLRANAIGALEALHLTNELTKTPAAASSTGVNAAAGHTSAAGPGKGKPTRRPATAHPNRGRRLPSKYDPHRDDIIRRYQAGESTRQLGAAFNGTDVSIANFLRREGITLRPRGGQPKHARPNPTGDTAA